MIKIPIQFLRNKAHTFPDFMNTFVPNHNIWRKAHAKEHLREFQNIEGKGRKIWRNFLKRKGNECKGLRFIMEMEFNNILKSQVKKGNRRQNSEDVDDFQTKIL